MLTINQISVFFIILGPIFSAGTGTAQTVSVPKLNDPCTSKEFCQSIKFSNCSEGFCECLPGYVKSYGQCLGKKGSRCSIDSECDPIDSICLLGTCQCPESHYFKNRNCYEFATRIGVRAHSPNACRYLKNSIYSLISRSCQCAPGYVEDYGQCLAKLGTKCSRNSECAPKDSVCLSETCQCPENLISKDDHCYEYKNELHGSCDINEQCAVSFSECSNGECKCKNEYWEQDNRCYAPKNGKCNTPEDCPTIWMDCIEGTCQQVVDWRNKGHSSSKPGATAIWNWDKYHLNDWYQFPYFTASTSHQAGDPGNLAWRKNYKLERVVAVDWFTPLRIWCRAKNANGQFVPGSVKFKENNKLCQIDHEGQKFSTQDYEFYVDLGPE